MCYIGFDYAAYSSVVSFKVELLERIRYLREQHPSRVYMSALVDNCLTVPVKGRRWDKHNPLIPLCAV